MSTRSIFTWLLAAAIGGALIGCGDDTTGIGGSDAGSDAGGGGDDAGPIETDSGGPVDAQTPPDGSEPDAGTPEPDYCPPAPDVGTAPSCPPLASRTEVTVSGDLTGDQSWTCDHIYRLTGLVYQRSGTLTIQAGTHVVGDNMSALIITSGARIHAVGHPDAPIVFGSSRPEGSRDRGDWGGVVLLGLAPINTVGGTNSIEGLPATESRGTYGGTDPTHDCGTIRFARIEFAGYAISTDNELNGLTLGGCGSNTLIDHVQVHRGRDDAFEVFGGAPNFRYLVATGMDDDGFDWDQGFVGNAQYVIVQRYTDSNSADPNGIEADNNRSNNDLTPRSDPTLWNVTLIGTHSSAIGTDIGMVLRRGSYGAVRNVIVQGFSRYGVDVRDASSEAGLAAGDLAITNGIFFENGADLESAVEAAALMTTPSSMNRFGTDPMLTAPYDEEAPDFTPAAGSAVGTGAAAPPEGGFFDATSTFVGAIGPGCRDWTAGWAAYPVD